MRINLPGTTFEARLSVKLSEILENPRDWILVVQPMANNEPISASDITAYYSAALDVNFLYLPNDISAEWNTLKSIESTIPFDALNLRLVQLPWAKNPIDVNKVQISEIKYAAKSVAMTSETAPVHILGRTK